MINTFTTLWDNYVRLVETSFNIFQKQLELNQQFISKLGK